MNPKAKLEAADAGPKCPNLLYVFPQLCSLFS